MSAFDAVSQWKTNALHAACGYDSRGHYVVGLQGIGQGSGTPIEHDIWDGRVFAWWLTDEELERIHANGVEEIARRGIPQWRDATP